MKPGASSDIPLKTHVEYGLRSLRNAAKLRDSARLLHSAKDYGRTLSLAISGQEEFSKFWLVLGLAMGRIAPERLSTLVHKHEPKHVLASFQREIQPLIRAQFSEADLDLEGREPLPLLEALVDQLKAQLPWLEQQVDDRAPELEERLSRIAAGALERERRRGLYVDLIGEGANAKVQTPESVTEAEASEQLDALDELLVNFAIEEAEELNTEEVADLLDALAKAGHRLLDPDAP